MYYNTNKLNGDELKIAEMKSLTQEALIKLLLEVGSNVVSHCDVLLFSSI